jgi:hypothetical protein
MQLFKDQLRKYVGGLKSLPKPVEVLVETVPVRRRRRARPRQRLWPTPARDDNCAASQSVLLLLGVGVRVCRRRAGCRQASGLPVALREPVTLAPWTPSWTSSSPARPGEGVARPLVTYQNGAISAARTPPGTVVARKCTPTPQQPAPLTPVRGRAPFASTHGCVRVHERETQCLQTLRLTPYQPWARHQTSATQAPAVSLTYGTSLGQPRERKQAHNMHRPALASSLKPQRPPFATTTACCPTRLPTQTVSVGWCSRRQRPLPTHTATCMGACVWTI